MGIAATKLSKIFFHVNKKKIKKCPKTKKKKKSKSKMSKLRSHKNKNPKQSKLRRRASLKLHKKQTNDATFFGLLPELDEENEKKQMSENEIVRFENELSNKSDITKYRDSKFSNTLEEEWKIENDDAMMIVTTKQFKHTPLWRAATNLPQNEEFFDVNRLKASNDLHPLNRFDDNYQNKTVCLTEHSLASHNDQNEELTHSQIVAKYQQNVTCFKIDSDAKEQSQESKESLFANTDFSADQMKINSLLNDSNEDGMDINVFNKLSAKWKQNKKKRDKYARFEYPDD